jgi:hypothetical protein
MAANAAYAIKEPLMIPYGTLFDTMTAHSGKNMHTVRDFLETYLVINKARSAALIKIDHEDVKPTNTFLRERTKTTGLTKYRENWYFVFPYSAHTASLVSQAAADPPKTHQIVGQILGYITPFDILTTNVRKGTDAMILVSAHILETDKTYDLVQLVPQKVHESISDEDIHAYYAPMIAMLEQFNKFQNAVILDNIRVVIRPSRNTVPRGRSPSTELHSVDGRRGPRTTNVLKVGGTRRRIVHNKPGTSRRKRVSRR